MLLCFDSGSSTAPKTQQPVGHRVRGPNRKWERTQGRLVFRVRIQIVPLCVSENRERGMCACDCLWWSFFYTVKTHMHAQTKTHANPQSLLWLCSWWFSLRVLVMAVVGGEAFRLEWQVCHTSSIEVEAFHTHTHTCPYSLQKALSISNGQCVYVHLSILCRHMVDN